MSKTKTNNVKKQQNKERKRGKNMKVLAATLSEGTRVEAAQRNLNNLSQAVDLGGSYRLFLPITKTSSGEADLRITQGLGRKLNAKSIKKIFVGIDEFSTNTGGRFVDDTVLPAWKRITDVLYDAMCRRAIEQVKAEAQRDADESGEPIDSVALNQKITQINVAYYGNRDVTPAVYATENKLMDALKVVSATEALLVPLKAGGEPNFGKAERVAIELNVKKRNSIMGLLKDKNFCDPEDNYLEVQYSYVGSNKREAGQSASFNGVSKEISLKAKYPTLWVAEAPSLLGSISPDAETMMAANPLFASAATVEETVLAIRKFAANNKVLWTYVDFESDTAKRSAADIVEFGVCDKSPRIKEKFLAIIPEKTSEEDVSESEIEVKEGSDLEDVRNAKTLQELTAMVDVADDPDEIESL